MKYKVIECTQEHFKNIEFDLDNDHIEIGKETNILGMNVNITQNGGGVIAGSTIDTVIVIQEVSNTPTL